MRVLVCGSRHWTDPAPIRAVLAALPADTVVVHGAAPGADTLAATLAKARGLDGGGASRSLGDLRTPGRPLAQ